MKTKHLLKTCVVISHSPVKWATIKFLIGLLEITLELEDLSLTFLTNSDIIFTGDD